jgi:uncharacterized protein (TIGR03085 family)
VNIDRRPGCSYGAQISGTPPQRAERLELCDLFLERGENAATLCEGWDAGDLATHLFVREHRPDAAAGLVVPPLAKHLDRVMKQTRSAHSFEALVAKVRSGPPAWWRPIDRLANLNEYFVHHEDLRRGNGDNTPRAPDAVKDLEDALWRVLRQVARLSRRALRPVGLDLVRENGETIHAVSGDPVATLRGRPGELALYLSGRKSAAQVELDGDARAVEALQQASFGI